MKNPIPPSLHFVVNGPPLAKQRARKGKSGRFYTPTQTEDYEELIGYHALAAKQTVVAPWPTWAWYEVQVCAYLASADELLDVDNVAKVVLDAMNGVVYKDDCRVVRLLSVKEQCSAGVAPGVHVAVQAVFPTVNDFVLWRGNHGVVTATEGKLVGSASGDLFVTVTFDVAGCPHQIMTWPVAKLSRLNREHYQVKP